MKSFKVSAIVACMCLIGAVQAQTQPNILGEKNASVPEACTGVSSACLDAAVKAAKPKPHKAVAHAAVLPATGVAGLPEAKPGECYARIYYPAETKTETSKVLLHPATSRVDVIPGQTADEEQEVVVREASKRLEVVPATYKTVTEEVVVREASKRLEVVPATYKTVTEDVIVRAESKRMERVPGGFDEVSEQVLVTPAHSMWKKGVNIVDEKTKKDENGDVLCLVEVPAVYKTVSHRVPKPDTVREVVIPAVHKTVTRTVVDQPASTTEVAIPAVTKTVTRTVVDQPASSREIDIPAVTKMVKVTKVVSDPKENRVDTPAEYGEVSRTSVVRPAGWEWRSILCETNATPTKINEIQTALKDKGYPVASDGTDNLKSTLNSLNAFRQSQGIRTDGYITTDSLKALGVAAK